MKMIGSKWVTLVCWSTQIFMFIFWKMNFACGSVHYLLPPRHQFLKLTQVYRLFLGMMCRFILVVKQHKVIKSSSLWCCVVNVNRHRRTQLASYSNSFSFTLGWLTLVCPLHSSVSLHHFFFLLTSLWLFFYFPPLICALTICLYASSASIFLWLTYGGL